MSYCILSGNGSVFVHLWVTFSLLMDYFSRSVACTKEVEVTPQGGGVGGFTVFTLLRISRNSCFGFYGV